MARTKLTKRNVERIRKQTIAKLEAAGAREAIVWDEELVGLGLRVGPSGDASWLVYKRLGQGGKRAKQIRTVFATYGEIPDPDKAREKARPIIEAIRNGVNPNADKRTTRATDIEAFRNGQLGELLDRWEKAKPKEGRYGEEVSRMIKVDIKPGLGEATLVREITRRNINVLIDSLPRGTARSVFAILRPFLKWCVDREVIAVSPMDGLTPPELCGARDRVLTNDELLLIWKAIETLPYPWNQFYKLLFLTAQRRDEVAGMGWTEISDARREWIIPGARTKNGKEHLVHISPMAWSVIEEISKRSNPRDPIESKYLFTTTTDTHVSGYSKAKAFLDARITKLNNGRPIPLWRIHDIRRTVATGMGGLGFPPHIIEHILNHSSGVRGGIVGVYQRFEHVEERREAIEAWAKHINELLLADMTKEREALNVLAFSRKANSQ